MNQFYITTPLYYVNDKPHIGTAYTTIMADVLTRYHKLFNDDTLFLTGTDEHGQKCQQAAEKRGLEPLVHCNEMVENFKTVWKELNINYDIFFRTTDEFHTQAVQSVLTKLFKNGDIYQHTYEGWYSVSEEIFYTEKDLIDGKSPKGDEVTKVSEKNYFFKMSKYQQKLIDHIQSHPNFILPESRRNEVLGFLKQPLNDLCISRPKNRLSWGIEIPFDKEFVTYVWFDALLNYATGVGLEQKNRNEEFQKWWVQTGAIHLIGKDIITTHAVYWTTMLLAMDLPLPKTIFAHGWILNKDLNKMSKSKGHVVNPLDMKAIVGTDPFRYFLVKDIHFGNDAPYSEDLLFSRINTDLANNFGNLLSRCANLIEKFFAGHVPNFKEDKNSFDSLIELATSASQKVEDDINKFAPSYALDHVIELLTQTNKFLEENAPWKLAKTDLESAGNILYVALEVLRISSIILYPVMPDKMTDALNRLGNQKVDFKLTKQWGVLKSTDKILKGDPLFPRIEIKPI